MNNTPSINVVTVHGTVLHLSSGDTLAITPDRILSNVQCDALRDYIAPHVPTGVRVLVLDPGFAITAIKAVKV